ncbi:LysM peptidoglycan-binding domain-containing protein [Hyphomicrobium sp. B1]|uniref:LysM peptidoglycan-binding domain-containing protein n=1 Tax=Hyphomicrobium sp. B1 TaxID=3075651 RepID=UPI003C30CF3B
MMSCFGVGQCGRLCLKSATAFSLIFASISMAGCSADITRFDSTSFALNDPPETGSNPAPRESVYSNSLSDNQPVEGSTPRGPYGAGASSVQVAALPDANNDRSYAPPPAYRQPTYQQPAYQQPAYRQPTYNAKPSIQPRSASVPSHGAPIAKGEAIEVQPGDTLYGLSRRHHVSLAELTTLNNLNNPNIHPGQKLYLPAADGGGYTPRSSAAAASAAVEAARPAPVPLAQATPDVAVRYNASYTVQPGDSLYGISRAHGVKFSELQQVNGISDPRRVKPGTVLRIPGRGGNEAPARMAANTPPAPPLPPAAPRQPEPTAPPPPIADAQPSEPQRYGEATTTQPTIINGEKRVASLSNQTNDASPVVPPVQPSPPERKPEAAAQPVAPEQKVAIAAPPPSSGLATVDSVKLRWPASGKIIAGFGSRPDGTHNDGINLQVPLGTDVHAAESGVVAYAGSELKGYGNLVLLRHDNGWVTAYAHNDELLVKRGDKVRRGQVIAKAGKTGSVDRPQLHFELRQGSRPVDPIPYLEKL